MGGPGQFHLKVALLQTVSHGPAIESNALKGEDLCRRAAHAGADVALFPEMWSIGYAKYPQGNQVARADWLKLAVPRDGQFVERFRRLARELRMAIAITYLEAHAELPRDSVTLISSDGLDVFTYAKVHTCAWDSPEESLTAGSEFYVGKITTRSGDTVKVGAMICFDRQFPESARLLMLKGAEIILTPNACELHDDEAGLGDIRIAQFRSRAFENAIGVAMANYAAPQLDGHSVAFDVNGETLLQAGPEDGIFVAEFDLRRIREWRRVERSNIWRRPETYGALSDLESIDPLAQSAIDTIAEERRRRKS
jgi:predicted amidohydrolase